MIRLKSTSLQELPTGSTLYHSPSRQWCRIVYDCCYEGRFLWFQYGNSLNHIKDYDPEDFALPSLEDNIPVYPW